MMFGDRLRHLREERGITQRELGKVINASDRVIGYYESNNRFPKDENTLKKIADFFEVSVDYLLGRTDKRVLDSKLEIKGYHSLNVSDLPEEAVKQVEEYIEFVKQKYNPDGSLKKR